MEKPHGMWLFQYVCVQFSGFAIVDSCATIHIREPSHKLSLQYILCF